MKPLIPQTVLPIVEHKLHRDLVNVIGLNILSGILPCAGMVNQKLLSQTKKDHYLLSKEELIELLSKTWDADGTEDELSTGKKFNQFINKLLNNE